MTGVRRLYGYAFASSFVALVLSILPMPEAWEPWRIAWPQLVVVYWCIASPHYFGIRYAWVMGLLIDLLNHDILGQNALSFIVLAYTAIVLRQYVLYLAVWRQVLPVGVRLVVPAALAR